MTLSLDPSTNEAATIRPAAHQSPVPADKILHSGNAGFIIHRFVQLKYAYRKEGRKFFFDVIEHMNQQDINGASFFAYEELFGSPDRLHWLINWNSPVDYAVTLEMVDHDPKMMDLLEGDVLEEETGPSAWGKMVVEGSMQEKIIVPQHHEHGDDDDGEDDNGGKSWVPVAWPQSSQPREQQLNSATAPFIVHKIGSATHQFRKEARYFAFDWQELVNRKLAGRATSYLYEETFGVMDQLHWLIHLASFDDYLALQRLQAEDPDFQALFEKQYVAKNKGGGTWARTYVDGGTSETLLVPYQLKN